MGSRYINVDDLLCLYNMGAIEELGEYGQGCMNVIDDIRNATTADVVSRGLFDQYKWERDIAIEQLNELGLSFGQKIDGVYLNKEEYEKLLEYKHMYEELCK